MRTNIVIDDNLLAEAKELSNLTTKKDIVEESIKAYIALLKRQNMLELFGKVEWMGDLDEMRSTLK
ncbi:Transcription regulator of the Arc/MetJ class [Spirosomataceae bacterium TFI 002]|nr:Transcription regulator of the Arc/MetJ class [Spirosomataceae bacterium TFI 002]